MRASTFLASPPQCAATRRTCQEPCKGFRPEGVGDRGRDFYLDGIDGLLFGDSPNEGYVRGTEFLHPVLGVRFFQSRTSFRIDNNADAVLATGPGDLAIRFDGGHRQWPPIAGQIYRERLGHRAR